MFEDNLYNLLFDIVAIAIVLPMILFAERLWNRSWSQYERYYEKEWFQAFFGWRSNPKTKSFFMWFIRIFGAFFLVISLIDLIYRVGELMD